MMRKTLIPAALAALLALPALAQVPDNLAEVTIVPGWRDAEGMHVAGLSIRLAPGWKTYWRAPGDGGIPPLFNWSGSTNLTDVEVRFPVPEVFDLNGVRTIGYKVGVLFPLLIRPGDSSAPIRLAGEIEIGVCEDVCIPVSFTILAELSTVGQTSEALSAALDDRPDPGGALRCEISPIADGLRVAVETDTSPLGDAEVAVVEAGEAGLWISAASVRRRGGTLRAEVEMVPPTAKPFALARSDVRLTVLGNGHAVETLGCD